MRAVRRSDGPTVRPSARPTSRPSDQRGFALIAALWLLVAISAIGLEFGLRARSRQLAVANAVEASMTRAAALSGLEEAYAALDQRLFESSEFDTRDPNLQLDPWGGSEQLLRDTIALGGCRVVSELEDAGVRLNLNLATEEELRRLFRALRVDFGLVDRLAQMIADWRDADNLHRSRGAERDDYIKDGLVVLPANAPFRSVEELRFVKGMTPELLQRLRPTLTVDGSGRINANSASRPVLLALPGMTEMSVIVLLQRRSTRQPLRDLNTLLLLLPSGPREELQAEQMALQSRLVFVTSEIIASSVAWREGSPVRSAARGLFVRSGERVLLVNRKVD